MLILGANTELDGGEAVLAGVVDEIEEDLLDGEGIGAAGGGGFCAGELDIEGEAGLIGAAACLRKTDDR